MGIVISGNKNLKFIKAVYYQPSQSSENLEFPLYLYTDYCEEHWGFEACTREADEIGAKYFEYLYDVVQQYDNSGLDESELNSLGIEIYIDDLKVTYLSLPFDNSQYLALYRGSFGGTWDDSGKISVDLF